MFCNGLLIMVVSMVVVNPNLIILIMENSDYSNIISWIYVILNYDNTMCFRKKMKSKSCVHNKQMSCIITYEKLFFIIIDHVNHILLNITLYSIVNIL